MLAEVGLSEAQGMRDILRQLRPGDVVAVDGREVLVTVTH